MTQQQDGSFLLGFKFAPTDEEILDYFLRTRIYGNNSISQYSSVIKEFDIYSTEPWNLPRDFFGYRNEESDIYFFTPRRPTSKNSKRANRSAGQGFWDGYAKDEVIKIGSETVGHKTALNFKLIRGGEKIKSEWIMHEYRLTNSESTSARETTFDDFVLCKIHRKKSMSNKATMKRWREDATDDGFVEEQRMVKRSRVEEDQMLPVNFLQTSSMHQPQWSSLEKGASSSFPNVLMPEPSASSVIPLPEPSLQAGFQDNQGDFFLQEDNELFLDEFLRDWC